MTGVTEALELFYSYAHKDERLRNELNKHLYNLKRQSFIIDWFDRDISAGTDWEQDIDTHLNTAQIILLLVSPDFMASDYCYSVEMKRALERHEASEARVIPIILKPVDWTGSPFSKLQVLPRNRKPVTSWKDRNAAFLEIAKDIRDTIKELRKSSSINRTSASVQMQSALPSLSNSVSHSTPLEEVQALGTIWNVPYSRNLRFTDRESILQQLRELFSNDEALSKQPVALSGLGGMGKTQIALEYAYRYREHYPIVLWAKADSQETLTSELASFATLLKVPGQQEQDQQYALAAVKRWLEVHPNWLLILDNVEDLKKAHAYLPDAPQGHILLTMNSQVMHGVARRLDIDKMEPEYGALLLLRRVGTLSPNALLDRAPEQEREQATEIAEMLGGHPLAIDQAGAYIDENGANLHHYRELYAKRRTHLLTTREEGIADHPESVVTTLSLSFEKVAQTNQVALELLRCLAFLHPDAIPDVLLEQGASQLGEPLQTVITDTLEFEKAIGKLRRYSLVRRNPDGGTLTIHRLVQDVVKDNMHESSQRQWAERVVRAINQAFPTVEFASWETCQQYLPHAQNCLLLIETWHFAFPEAARLLYEAGRYLDERGQYTEAFTMIKRSLSIREQILGAEHREVAQSSNALAELYYKRGLRTEAEPLWKRALVIYEQIQGPNHPDTSRSLNNLALLYEEQGRYSEAESLFKRALAIDEQVQGPNHPDTAAHLNNLASLYEDQGRYSEAESLFKRALAINEQILGPDHPDTAASLNNLALLYKKQGRYSKAEPLFKRALAINEQIFGSENPSTIIVLSNYVGLLKATNRKERAAEMEARLNILRRNISKRN